MSDLKNGFWIQNSTGVNTDPSKGIGGEGPAAIRVEGYDANKQRIGAPTAAIPYNNGVRFISADHIGSSDHIYILAFYDSPNYNPPPGIGILSGPKGSGGGGGFSISVAGNGFGLSGSGSVTVTQAFSQPSLVAKMELKTYNKEPKLAAFGDPARISALTIVSMKNDEGDDILAPVYVRDFLTDEMDGPPGWDTKWFFGWSPPLVKS